MIMRALWYVPALRHNRMVFLRKEVALFCLKPTNDMPAYVVPLPALQIGSNNSYERTWD